MHVALTPSVNNNGIAKASPKQSQTWTQPTDATNSITVGSIAKGAGSSASSVTATTVLSVSLTATWQTTGGDSASDPAPTSVMVLEGSAAYANDTQTGPTGAAGATTVGTVDDGLGQGDIPDANGNVSRTKYVTCPVQGGSFTLALAPTASASASPGPSGTDSSTGLSYIGTCTASAGIGPLSFTIHAQPYNWHITGVVANGDNSLDTSKADGSLEFYYDWSSTSGSKANLNTCFIHEWVTYPGPVGTAAFPLSYTMPAPFSGSLFNPTAFPGTGSSGQPATDSSGGYDHQGMPAFSTTSPHVTGGFTGTQQYEFDDTATGETNTIVPGPDSGPLSIVRSVSTSGGVVWQYTLTKSGYTVTKTI